MSHNLNAASLRRHLGALAALTELDEDMTASNFEELESMISAFERRSKWMLSGRLVLQPPRTNLYFLMT